jgi:predicted O-linked N-acetylglucosamine transferase (SPINDLY family)
MGRRWARVPDDPLFSSRSSKIKSAPDSKEECVTAEQSDSDNLSDPAAYMELGAQQQRQGKLDEATNSFRKAIALNPKAAEPHISLGLLLTEQGKPMDAITSYRQAIFLQPDAARTHFILGATFHVLNRFDEAIGTYRRALALQPDYPEAHHNLGMAFKAKNKIYNAIESYRKAVALKPDFFDAHLNLGAALFDLGNAQEAATCFHQAYTVTPDDARACSDYLMALQYLPGYSLAHLFREHTGFGERHETPLRADWPAHAKTNDGPRRLKIGFVSADFRLHPVGCFLEGVLRHIDRDVIDVTLYSNNDKSDLMTERLRALRFTWTPILLLSDGDFATRIRNDGIDILVDLSGHTGKNRLLAFAHKPAPIQVTWLGYWATTGLRAMDYILADEYGIPREEVQYYVEKPWYLPNTRLCFAKPLVDVATNALPALQTGQVTFGCFNNLTKITDAVVALWARILRALPQARLFLKSSSLSDPAGQQSVLERFAAQGITAEQLALEGKSSYDQYFLAYHRLDIALDPFPFTGGTTSFDGLWMGVPMITLRGDRLIARQGEGILHNLGMSDWIAEDEDAYVALAIARAGDLQGLANLRTQLREKLSQSPLCDAPRFARDLEAAFLGMWEARE